LVAAALIKFVQGATVGVAGQALFGATGTAVSVSNAVNTGIASWEIELLSSPAGSAVAPAVLAFSNNGSTPAAAFTPDVRGPYRMRLRVWEALSRSGDPTDTDIRCFGVKQVNGFYRPAPQIWPRPLPPVASGEPGAKADENNFGGQANGWAGNGADGLLDNLITTVLPTVIADGIATGSVKLAEVDATNLPDWTEVRVKSVRRRGYLDKSSTLTAAAGVVVAAVGGGRWILDGHPDRRFQEQTEWWFASTGSVEGSGASEATAINDLNELWRRIGYNSGNVTTTVTLYTAANLTETEQALLDLIIAAGNRPWRVVSGEMPFVPRLRFSAQNIDGQDNTTLTPGQEVDWTSIGSDAGVVASGTPGARPAYILVGEAGKLRGKSVVRYTSSIQDLVTGNLTTFAKPTWILSIVKVNAAGTRVWIDGNDGANRNAFIDSSGACIMYAGTSSGGIPGLPAMAKGDYHAIVGVFNGDRSLCQLDGVTGDVDVDSGDQALDGLSLGGVLSAAPLTDGDEVEIIVHDGNGSDTTQLNDWLEYHYGIFPQ